jgi:hypothetical protein
MQLNCGRTFFAEELAAAGMPASYVARCFRDGRRAELLALDSAHIGATLDVCMPYIRAFENLVAQATKLHAHYLDALRERDALLTQVVASLNAVSGVEASAEQFIHEYYETAAIWQANWDDPSTGSIYFSGSLTWSDMEDEFNASYTKDYKLVWANFLRLYLHMCAQNHGAHQYRDFIFKNKVSTTFFVETVKQKFDPVFDTANDCLVFAFRRVQALQENIEQLKTNAARLRVWGELMPLEMFPAADDLSLTYVDYLKQQYGGVVDAPQRPVGEMINDLANFSADSLLAELTAPSGRDFSGRILKYIDVLVPMHVGRVANNMPSTVRDMVQYHQAYGLGRGDRSITAARMVRCIGDACRGVFCAADGVCKVCSLTHCVECHTVRGEDHVCDPDMRANVTTVLSECRSCPRCAAQISRAFGCNTMFCTACRTMFDWETGNALRKYAHNPHLQDLTSEQRRAVARSVGAAADDADAARNAGEARSGRVEESEERPQAVNGDECRAIDDTYYALALDRLIVHSTDALHPIFFTSREAMKFYNDALHYHQLSNDWRTHDTLIHNSFELTNRRARIAYLLGHKLAVVPFLPVERIAQSAANIKLTPNPFFVLQPAVPSSEGDYTGTMLNVDAARIKRATKAELAATYAAQIKEALDAFLACTTTTDDTTVVVNDADTMRKMVEAMEATKADFEPRFNALCPKRKRDAAAVDYDDD